MEIPLPWPVEINLSRPALLIVLQALGSRLVAVPVNQSTECELDNFSNLLQNLLERSKTEPGNLDLIGG